VPGRTSIADATYFDVFHDNPDAIEEAGRKNSASRLIRYPGENRANDINRVFSQGGNEYGPTHALLNKDYAGRPHFEWAYRGAYRASIEWLAMVRGWVVEDLGKSAFWDSMATFTLSGLDISVREAAAMNEGSLRWMFTYPGKWKGNREWEWYDMLADDCPSVPGMGVASSFIGVPPPLGVRWWEMALRLADGLIQAKSNNTMRVFSRQVYLETLSNISSYDLLQNIGNSGWLLTFVDETFGAWIGAEFADDDMVEDIEAAEELIPTADWSAGHAALVQEPANVAVLDTAAARMADSLRDRYNAVKWVHVTVPVVKDLDTGPGYLDVNNEEIGGKSDYWPRITVDGRSYYEAEYVDSSGAHTNWFALTPVWGKSTVPVAIRLYESDPTDHTDETMKLTPGTKDLAFTFRLSSGALAGVPNGVDHYIGHDGTYIRSKGSGDLRAGVVVKVARHGDHRIEFVTRMQRVDYQITMYINRHDNNHFDYAFTAVIGAGQGAQRPCTGFALPRPSILLSETVFRGGDRLETLASPLPYLQFGGIYTSECLHFGMPATGLEYTWQFNRSPRSTTTTGGRLLFEARVPPYEYEFPARLTVHDPYDVAEETENITVVIPRLAAKAHVEYSGKICSYFDCGNMGIVKLGGAVGMTTNDILHHNWLKAMLCFIRQYAELIDARRAREPRVTLGARRRSAREPRSACLRRLDARGGTVRTRNDRSQPNDRTLPRRAAPRRGRPAGVTLQQGPRRPRHGPGSHRRRNKPNRRHTALALRLPPQKRRDRTLAIVYNRGHEINNQYQREALDP